MINVASLVTHAFLRSIKVDFLNIAKCEVGVEVDLYSWCIHGDLEDGVGERPCFVSCRDRRKQEGRENLLTAPFGICRQCLDIDVVEYDLAPVPSS
jgi:hypothetical protein